MVITCTVRSRGVEGVVDRRRLEGRESESADVYLSGLESAAVYIN